MDLVVKAWKPVEWENLQIRIEEEVNAIGQRQDDGEHGRKVLLDESNKYRENTDKESRKVAVPLIKAFQKEVDRLTAKEKTTEAALIDICSRLTNIPDPLPILEQAPSWKAQAEKANQAIEEANQLRSTISQLHSEFSDLKNQDVTIRQLRERVKQLEEEKVKESEQAITETEKRLQEEHAAAQFETNMRSDKLKAENQSLEKKVSELEMKMRDTQRRLDTARQAMDQRESLEQEQIDILTKDLESANRRNATLEMDVARLTKELNEAHENSKRGGLEDIAAFGGLMKEKDEQIARLKEENKQLTEKVEADARKAAQLQNEMGRELEKQRLVIRDFETKVADMSDYEAIKKELRLLREIEFGEAATANEDAISRLGETVQTLDRLLAEKNRRLQNDNAQLRHANQKQQETLEQQGVELAELQKKTVEQEELIGRLERDLSVLGGRSAGGEAEDLTTLEVLEHLGSDAARQVDGSITGIVTAQRDRLRQKVSSLEEELVAAKMREKVQQSEIEKLTDDNVKLYGKIKFLQGCGNKSSVAVPVEPSGNYGEQYERRLDPFTKFSQAEKQRTYNKLQLHDRATLTIGRAIMSSGGARLAFFFYLVLVHLMIFMVLYRAAFSEMVDESFQKDCVENFAQHMKDHHHK